MLDQHSQSLVALLVEDEPADAELIAVRLESTTIPAAGVRPLCLLHSRSAADACDTLRRVPVDVILLDLTLPDAHGLEGLHRVRAASAATPVIVVTGMRDQDLAVEALRAGAQDYVLKPPPDGLSLARLIQYACERQRLLQALDESLHAAATAERHWRLLADISEALALSHDLGVALDRVARRIVPDVADCLVLHLTGKHELPAAARRWHVYGEHAGMLQGELRRLIALHGVSDVASAQRRDDIEALVTSHGLASATVTPIHVGSRVRGLLLLASTAQRPDAITNTAFARTVADRIDVALAQARLLRRAQRAVAARDRAVSIVSHDLRNPLNTIQICANALLDPEPAPPSGIRHMGELIQQSAAWMQQIVEELLDRASLDRGRLSLRRRPTDVAEVITAIQLMFTGLAGESGIELVLQEGGSLPPVDADPHRLLQALANLVGNALKFTPAGGRVVLDVRPFPDHGSPDAMPDRCAAVRFAVSDTGLGIPPEDLPHVFDWFWHSPRDVRSGVGLGLAIAKGIVEAHRGRLHVESEVGRGSTFWFTVPVVTDRAQARRRAGAVLA